MATWKKPKTSYKAEDQVTPDIFNTLAENEIYLEETKITTNQVQEATVLSEVSETRENLTEADTIMGAFSKIRKWFLDLKALAFKSTVTTTDINDSAVTNGKVADGAITSGKLGASSVITSKINASAVTDAKLATDSVITEKIKNLAVTSVKLADSCVTSIKLAPSAVTASKISNGAVTTDKLADSAVTNAKIESVAASKITGLATVATSGSYNDLSNKPSISSFTMTRGTYRVNYQYNLPATGIYLCFLKFTNAAGFTSVSCLGTMSNSTSVDNSTYSSVSSFYYDGGVKSVQLRCTPVSSTAIKYSLYYGSNTSTMPNTLFDGDGTIEIIMYKVSSFAAIS